MSNYRPRDLYVYDTVWHYSFMDSYTGKYYVYILPDLDDVWFQAQMADSRNVDFRIFSKQTVYPFFIQ